jgi:hypothetical protein
MIRKNNIPPSDSRKKQENILAPGPVDMLAFQRYTQQVWSKVAGRPISEEEARQIMENFGQLLHALTSNNGERS